MVMDAVGTDPPWPAPVSPEICDHRQVLQEATLTRDRQR